MIPPFTGNGMTIAIEGAVCLLKPAIDYASGRTSWDEFLQQRAAVLKRNYGRRTSLAGMLHPFLLNPFLQGLVAGLARINLVPFHSLYRLTHA